MYWDTRPTHMQKLSMYSRGRRCKMFAAVSIFECFQKVFDAGGEKKDPNHQNYFLTEGELKKFGRRMYLHATSYEFVGTQSVSDKGISLLHFCRYSFKPNTSQISLSSSVHYFIDLWKTRNDRQMTDTKLIVDWRELFMNTSKYKPVHKNLQPSARQKKYST